MTAFFPSLSCFLAGALGLALGAAWFAALRWNATLYLAGPAPAAVLLHLLRVGTAAAGFTLAARYGAAALLAALAGFLAARGIAVRPHRPSVRRPT